MSVYEEISEVVKRAEADFSQYVNDVEGNFRDGDYHSHVVAYLSEWTQGKLAEQRAQIQAEVIDIVRRGLTINDLNRNPS